MQIFNLDISRKGIPSILAVKQGDVGRKFKVILTDGGTAYTVPEDAVFSVWFTGCSGSGNYSVIDDRSAVVVEENTAVVEIIAQMAVNYGDGILCLVLTSFDGKQIGLWNISYSVERVPGMGSEAAIQSFTALSESASKAAASAAAAKKATDDAVATFNDFFKLRAGFIYPLATETVPEGFLLCDGAEYSRTEYADLFEAIGSIYGDGDGETTFNVPNLSTRVPVGAGGDYAIGDTGGEEKHILIVGEMPSHYHRIADSEGAQLNYNSNGASGSGNSGISLGVEWNNMKTTSVGGGQPHNNMQPYTVVNYIIATGKGASIGGIYASQQTLSEEEKAKARENIGAVSSGQLDSAVKDTIDKTCPAFSESGTVVTCEPVEGYPLQVEWNKKNLLKNTAQSQTINGVTFTVNDDGSILADGISTDSFTLNLGTISCREGCSYILSGCPVGGSYNSSYRVYTTCNETNSYDLGEGVTFTATGDVAVPVYIGVNAGVTISSVVFHPMVRLAGTSAGYEPYMEAPTAITRCGKNLYNPGVSSGTKSGVTFTVNADGSVTANGTAEADAYFAVGNIALPVGDYILSGCPAGGSIGTHTLFLQAGDKNIYNRSEEAAFTNTDSAERYSMYIYIALGQTVSDLTFYPMVRPCGTDSGYEPRAAESFALGDTVPALAGVNTVYADAGLVTVTGRANPVPIIDSLLDRLAAVEAAIVNNT